MGAGAAGMDEATRPRTQGPLTGQDTRCENLDADQTDSGRVTPEGARTRLATRTSAVGQSTVIAEQLPIAGQ